MPALRGLAVLTGWGAAASALSDDALDAAGGRGVVAMSRPQRSGEQWRRASREGLLAIAAAEAAVADAGADPGQVAGERTALVYVTAAAYAPSNRRFIDGRGGSLHFAATAPAAAPAEVAIALGVAGPYAILIGGPPATLRAIAHAGRLIDAGVADRALVVAVEVYEECADLYARARRLMREPLVEAAACLWIDPGGGAIRLEPGPANGGRAALRRRLGETGAVEPLAALDSWRTAGALGTLELCGRWRGESLRLIWTDAMAGLASAHGGSSAPGARHPREAP